MVDAIRAIEISSAVLNSVLLLEVACLFYTQHRKSKENLSTLLMICFFSFWGSSIFYFLRFFVFFDVSFYRIEVALRFASFTTFVFLFERHGKNHRFPLLTMVCIACIVLISILHGWPLNQSIMEEEFYPLRTCLNSKRQDTFRTDRMEGRIVRSLH